MGSVGDISCNSTRLLFSAKAASFETSLHKNLETFKELIEVAEQIQSDLETCESELKTQREKCERKTCCSSKMYEKILESKNSIIQLAVSTALIIDETKNLNMISKLLKILCGDVEILTPPKESQDNKENVSKTVLSTPNKIRLHHETKSNSPLKKKKKSPEKENVSIDDVSFKDESVSEIDGTPGRTSPLFQLRKLKSNSILNSLSGTSTESRDKKKCPDNWNTNTPDAKQIKLCYTSPKRTGKGKASRQSRLVVVPLKTSSVVDLTCSPDISGSRSSQNLFVRDQNVASQNPHVQLLIKKESSDNDDTILPSPTSGPPNIALSRTSVKDSQKTKRPLSLIKIKTEEVDEVNSPIIQFMEKKSKNNSKDDEMPLEESINILKSNRFAKSPYKAIKVEQSSLKPQHSPQEKPAMVVQVPVKTEQAVQFDQTVVQLDDDATRCEESSISILQHDNKLEQDQNSPSKRPLGENQNVGNVPTDHTSAVDSNNKRKLFENIEPVYKEPTVRKKAEKMALPAWCCDECKNFFGNLYSDDAERIAAVIARCSKHRGRANPARPRTPPGFWHPRWDVPLDTEEFNRRNDAH